MGSSLRALKDYVTARNVAGSWEVGGSFCCTPPFLFSFSYRGEYRKTKRPCIKGANCSIILPEIISRHLMNKEITTKIFRKDKQVQTDNHYRKMEEMNPSPMLVCFSSTSVLKGIADYMLITEFVLLSRM